MLPDDDLPQFDTLYVVSDLHLGGLPGFQIFNAGASFRRFIDHLRSTAPERKVALLINGDLVDFLAESPALAFDPTGAVTKLNRLVNEPAFSPVWQGLQKFVATKNRWLLINLGNHDLELALPWVRAKLLNILAGDNDAARGRISLTFDGTGIRCHVGNAEVLALHGNEVDDWNVTDFETLRRLGRDSMLGRQISSWVPNAGAKLVIEIMNSLKRRFPFIDLLKPEGPAVVPTLLALAPDQRDKILAIAAVASRLMVDKIRRSIGLLGQTEPSVDIVAGSITPSFNSLASVDGLNQMHLSGLSHPAFKAALLRETEAKLKEGVDPMMLVSHDQQGDYLGLFNAIGKFFKGSSPSEVLREALEALQKDQSFDPSVADDTFRLIDEQSGDRPTFIIAGHTHLERALPRQRSRGWYFNSGTWVRLVQLTPAVLANATHFQTVFNAFNAGTMAALDALPELVLQRLTVVAVWTEGTQTFGELNHVDPVTGIMQSVVNTRFPKL